ncbi:MAG TPA: hypothetical protein VGM59_13465 [Dongiaceae bacterium]
MRRNSPKIRLNEELIRQVCVIAFVGLGVVMMGLDLIEMVGAR